MKAVMLSIQLKYCELIARGKKTIEVRKTRPSIETPFKCYIYETKRKVMKSFIWKNDDGLISIPNGAKVIPINKTQRRVKYNARGKGKVIGEFVCDKIEQYVNVLQIIGEQSIELYPDGLDKLNQMCLSEKEFYEYGGAVFGYKQHVPNDLKHRKNIFGWHISDLKIYDTPKELGEFRKEGYMTEEQWLYALYPNTHCHYAAWAKKFEINRPPQSWCYVEEK